MKVVKIVGPVLRTDGYGEMAKQLALGLHEAGAKVKIKSIRFSEDDKKLSSLISEKEKIKELMVEDYIQGQPFISSGKDVDIVIQCLTPDNFHIHYEPGKLNIGYTMWETDKLPEHWIRLCNLMDHIFVPSKFCLKTFKECGVKNVSVVPILTNTTKFSKVKRNENLHSLVEDKFVFYSIFQWSERKNPTALLNSYYSKFGSEDKCILILKSYIGNDNERNREEIAARVKDYRNNIKRNNKDYPRVMCIADQTSDEQVLQIHKHGDCYLAPVRGEGWGLPVFDAALIGNKIIATDNQSYCDFLNSKLHNLIPYQTQPVFNMSGLYTPDQKWANVNQKEFAENMRAIYESWLSSRKDSDTENRINWAKNLITLYDRTNYRKFLNEILFNSREKSKESNTFI